MQFINFNEVNLHKFNVKVHPIFVVVLFLTLKRYKRLINFQYASINTAFLNLQVYNSVHSLVRCIYLLFPCNTYFSLWHFLSRSTIKLQAFVSKFTPVIHLEIHWVPVIFYCDISLLQILMYFLKAGRLWLQLFLESEDFVCQPLDHWTFVMTIKRQP